jgi:hypothetical protein
MATRRTPAAIQSGRPPLVTEGTTDSERRRRQTMDKARFRDESLRRHLSLPIEERLRIALSLIIPRSRHDRAGR